MEFLVEDGTGLAGATALISVMYFRDYWTLRGLAQATPGAASAELDVQIAIVQATDYVHRVFGPRLAGRKRTAEQGLFYPADFVYDSRGCVVEGTPGGVKDATAEYAFRALSAPLLPDPSVPSTGTQLESASLGPLRAAFDSNRNQQTVRKYPAADRLMLEFLSGGGSGTTSFR